MNFLVAPNAFKGTLTATEAGRIIENVLRKHFPSANIILQPVADGGDGTCSLLIDSLKLQKISIPTLNPIGQPTLGFFGYDAVGKRAFLDVSTASGIALLNRSQLLPKLTSTFGTGLVIQRALDVEIEEVILGLGGTSSIDLGTGILAALGVHFLDQQGRELIPFIPDYLSKIHHIQFSPKIPKIRFSLLCDVRNPFFGENGAIPVFGIQKGLDLMEVRTFETTCERVVSLFAKKSKLDWVDREGFGAAGGIGLGLSMVFPTQINFGANRFFELIGLEHQMDLADWIITGEGRYDSQSDQGKASYELLQLAKKKGKKIALITSGTEGENAGFDQIIQLPELDFTKPDFKETSKASLETQFESAVKNWNFEY